MVLLIIVWAATLLAAEPLAHLCSAAFFDAKLKYQIKFFKLLQEQEVKGE